MSVLDDILSGDGGNFDDIWDGTAAAADDSGPLPAGEYQCLLASGELAESRHKRTPSYKMTLDVLEPAEFAGRRIWHDVWLTAKALPSAKRDLARIGIVSPSQLRQPCPVGLVLKVRVVVRVEDDGTQRNRVVTFAMDDPPTTSGPHQKPPEADPGDTRDSGGFDWRSGGQDAGPDYEGPYRK